MRMLIPKKASTVPATINVDFLIVGGGGGGGYYVAGGGGGGDVNYQTSQTLTIGTTYNISVGAGGAGETGVAITAKGSNSTFTGYTA